VQSEFAGDLGKHELSEGLVTPSIAEAPAAMAAQPRTHPTGPARVQPGQGRVFVPASATPQFLTGFFEGHTDAQGKRSVADYLGKWMPVRGPVIDVQVFEKSVAVSLRMDKVRGRPLTISVVLWFSGEWMDRVKLLSPDERIAAIGRIDEITEWRINLRECELA
jgi:hypothetical protein